MAENTSRSWWKRKLWILVVFPLVAAVLLAGVSVFKGWLHQQAGFDAEGKPVIAGVPSTSESKKDQPSAKPRPRILPITVYQRLVADLQRKDAEVRPRLRYLTLVHRHNEPACTDADLEAERHAVRELLAILGRAESAQGVFIDPEQLLCRIDLEDFDWEAATDWHLVVAHYRYGLSGGSSELLAKLRQQVEQLTDDTIPVIRADWFVVALTRPPLAGPKGLLQMPANDLPEAVCLIGRRYPAQTLDLAACARELDLDNDQALADLIRQQERLRSEFGLAPLLQGELIRREWWESDRNFFSPYQELARLLKLGKPVRVQ